MTLALSATPTDGTFTGILLVDDEPIMSRLAHAILAPLAHPTHAVTTGQAALDFLARTKPQLIILDLNLPDMTGLDVLTAALEMHPQLPVIMLTASADAAPAVRAPRIGAFDYLTKPVNHEELMLAAERALERQRLIGEVHELRDELRTSHLAQRMGPSAEIAELAERVNRVASSRLNVLLLGETGSGKEVVARALHMASGRADQPFVAVDCGAIPDALLESELFGHEEGAFTGARRNHKGQFRLAEGGTLFLDEIGNMTPASQAKLLRVLEERKLRPLGGGRPVDIDVRVIAATNENLDSTDTTFRRDLFYRLAEVTIHVPALRPRRADIAHLARRFCEEACLELERDVSVFDGDAIARLEIHDWPGNVRELRNVVRRVALLCNAKTVRAADIGDLGRTPIPPPKIRPKAGAPTRTLREIVEAATEQAERDAIAGALAATDGARGRAARILDVDVKTLYRKMLRYGLSGA